MMQVFDVVNFDMMTMLKLPYVPQCAAWIYKVGHCHLVMPTCQFVCHHFWHLFCADLSGEPPFPTL